MTMPMASVKGAWGLVLRLLRLSGALHGPLPSVWASGFALAFRSFLTRPLTAK